jgi:hypothetical protein
MLDSRLNIVSSSSNPKLHEFYRVYFDKPSRKKQEKLLLGNYSKNSYPNLRSTLEKFSDRLPLPKSSKKHEKLKELGWDPNFHVKVSKDNNKYYKDCREFFDSPMVYDHKSTSRGSIRSPLLSYFEKSRRIDSREKFFWSSLYDPVSEKNIVRHKSQRVYFS